MSFIFFLVLKAKEITDYNQNRLTSYESIWKLKDWQLNFFSRLIIVGLLPFVPAKRKHINTNMNDYDVRDYLLGGDVMDSLSIPSSLFLNITGGCNIIVTIVILLISRLKLLYTYRNHNDGFRLWDYLLFTFTYKILHFLSKPL